MTIRRRTEPGQKDPHEAAGAPPVGETDAAGPGRPSSMPGTGEILTVEMDGVAFGGDAVGRRDGVVVFTPFAMPGDRAEVEITAICKRFLRGRIRRILRPSPERIPAPCPEFGRCGGCQLQHIPYPRQTSIKEDHVREILRRIGHFPDPPVAPIVPSPASYHYRGKAEFHVVRERTAAPVVGFVDCSGQRVIPVAACGLVHPSINGQLCRIRQKAGRPGLRTGRRIVWFQDENPEADRPEDSGGGVLRTVKGRRLVLPRNGFFQGNLYLVDRLVDEVVRLAALEGGEIVLDGYCGAGLFSLFLASLAGRIVGIERSAEAAGCAARNLAAAGFPRARFLAGDMASRLGRDFPERRMDVAVLDPPRAGCDRTTLSRIADLQPRRIVYVSCHPPTQARDLRFLAECGYRLGEALPIDMFPQTGHIEVVSLLTRP